MRHVPVGIAAVVTIIALILAAAPADAITRLERSGTVGLSLFGDYGTVTGRSRYGFDFAEGGGYGITLRYTVHPHVSVGLYFQNQVYNAIPGLQTSDNDPVGIDKLVATQVMADLYLYRDRNMDASQYAVFGLGFYRPEVHLSATDDVLFPRENLVLSAGAGAEVFIRENWGLDLSGRAFAYFGNGLADQEREPLPEENSISFGLQGQVGFIYYLLR